MAHLEQNRDSLNPNWTLAEALTGGRGDQVTIGGETKHVVAYMGDFLFRPEQARTPLRVLSGGERARIMLARALAKPSNLLVLDEPTNDLDIETLDVLEDMLGAYQGTVILISHDRDFLDRIVNASFAPEGDGVWVEYAGGYTDMLSQRGRDFSTPAAGKRVDAKPEAEAKTPAPVKAEKRRLSFKDKHALETLPKAIAALEVQVARLRETLSDAGLYARDRGAFDKASAELTRAEGELAAAEERWLELEMLAEEVGRG